MSGPDRDQAATAYGEAAEGPPRTGEAAVDDALLGLSGIAATPLSEHHDRLARAHESLHDALHTDTANGPTPRR